jgi:uncharacterized protein with HEPN domain
VKDERAYLLHAIEAIDAILSYTVDGRRRTPANGDRGREAVPSSEPTARAECRRV